MTDPDVPFPSLGSEELSWSPANPDALGRREIQRQTGTYRVALVPEVAAWMARIPADRQADVDDATGALARADGFSSGRLGPNARMSGSTPTIMLRTEYVSSSQIEQLTTSALQLALAAIDGTAKANAVTVLDNVHAMETAVGVSGQISVESILDMHRALLQGDRMMAAEAGRFRGQPVWIGPGGSGPLLADFVPPARPRVPAAMDDLVEFIAREDLPVIVQAAVAHAQRRSARDDRAQKEPCLASVRSAERPGRLRRWCAKGRGLKDSRGYVLRRRLWLDSKHEDHGPRRRYH